MCCSFGGCSAAPLLGKLFWSLPGCPLVPTSPVTPRDLHPTPHEVPPHPSALGPRDRKFPKAAPGFCNPLWENATWQMGSHISLLSASLHPFSCKGHGFAAETAGLVIVYVCSALQG